MLSSITIEKDQILNEEGEPLGDGYILSIRVEQLFKNTSDGKLAEKKLLTQCRFLGFGILY